MDPTEWDQWAQRDIAAKRFYSQQSSAYTIAVLLMGGITVISLIPCAIFGGFWLFWGLFLLTVVGAISGALELGKKRSVMNKLDKKYQSWKRIDKESALLGIDPLPHYPWEDDPEDNEW